MIFDSLGSNYTFKSAIRFLLATGNKQDSRQLKDYLNQKYRGQSELYYRGRGALTEALRRSGARSVAVNGYTCYAVEQAARAAGVAVVYVDIAENKYHFSISELQAAFKKQAFEAVIVQNTYGQSIDIAQVEKFCQERKLALIEDLAHSVGGYYPDGREVGTVGDFTMLSFGRDKHIDVVNGGALVDRKHAQSQPRKLAKAPLLTRKRDRLYPIISWKLRRILFPVGLGGVFQKLFQGLGLVVRASDGAVCDDRSLPDYRAKIVLAKFRVLETDRQRRLQLCVSVGRQVESGDNPIRLPITVEPKKRDQLLSKLKRKGMYLFDIWYSTPVYPQRYMSSSSYQPGSCPRAEAVAASIINLPLHINVTEQKLMEISNELK
ncbi:aminotransferase class I/II-fold pyridoxal phosphate-dependent enzyme [Candidatus Nomurabacteria bacterium]|nr:aminotransferase class I/II-fold pyridoxal phosphate-dependent enzyme [Candidatus Nomurabacteria bacterium]